MKKLLLIVLVCLFGNTFGQSVSRDTSYTQGIESTLKTTATCGAPWITTGYPAWTNYWAGYMINIINTSICPIEINSFEARFQGTSGYRIYTKSGTFVGFELNSAAWALVGTTNNLTGLSTVAPTPIPIAVNITIPPGGIQGFYLTRTDNVVANRHLYVPGTGTAGTTVYASDGNLSITEGSYIDPYFAFLNAGTRRPSLDVCYTINCVLEYEEDSVLTISQATDVMWKLRELQHPYKIVTNPEVGKYYYDIVRRKKIYIVK